MAERGRDSWTYAYDTASCLESVTSSMNEVWSFTSDPAGNLNFGRGTLDGLPAG